MPIKDIPIKDSKCPECEHQLFIDPGYPGNYESPPEPTTVFCPECGYEREPEINEILQILGI